MSNTEDAQLLEQLYSTVSPKGFEALVRDLLEALGFDDVEVTGKPGDSGIDLKATLRRSEIPGIDTNVSCIIQAKRYQPSRSLNPRFVRELRGAMQSGQRGVLITTSRVSTKTIEEEALKDMSRIILVIDGLMLIDLCKANNIGVITEYKYEIDEDYFSKLEASEPELEQIEVGYIGSKLVTNNDLRARILRIPTDVKNRIGTGREIVLYFEDGTQGSFTVDKNGTYIGGVTIIFKKYGLLDSEGNPNEMLSEWEIMDDGFLVRFKSTEEKPNIAGVLEGLFGAKFIRLPGTSIFNGDGQKFLCRYSKRYIRDINYWYGVTPKDIELMGKEGVQNLAFFCSTKMVVTIDRYKFLEQIDNLNVTYSEPGIIRHYHMHFRESGKGVLWVLKGGATIELDVKHL